MSDGSDRLWSVRGVPDDVRKLAQEAADRAGLKIGPWVNHAIRRIAASDRGGVVGEVVSDVPSVSSTEVVAMLFTGLGQIADKPGCGGVAMRVRALLDEHLQAMATRPLPRRAPPKPRRITSEPSASCRAEQRE